MITKETYLAHAHRLPMKYQEMGQLRFVEGLTAVQMGARLGIPVSTLHGCNVRMVRALRFFVEFPEPTLTDMKIDLPFLRADLRMTLFLKLTCFNQTEVGLRQGHGSAWVCTRLSRIRALLTTHGAQRYLDMLVAMPRALNGLWWHHSRRAA